MNSKRAKKARNAVVLALKHQVSPEWAEAVFTAAGLTMKQQRRAVRLGIAKSRRKGVGLPGEAK